MAIEAWDVDGDGVLSDQEYEVGFRSVDVDGDGELSIEESMQLIIQAYPNLPAQPPPPAAAAAEPAAAAAELAPNGCPVGTGPHSKESYLHMGVCTECSNGGQVRFQMHPRARNNLLYLLLDEEIG